MFKFFIFIAFIFSLISCSRDNTAEKEVKKDTYVRVSYDLISQWNDEFNIDSPALWQSADGKKTIIIATSKAKHQLFVYDAENLKLINQIGGQGSEQLQFKRPNGIWVLDDLLFVCERDNRRIQILTLPDFNFVGFVGDDQLIRPYGLSVIKNNNAYQIYVTDQFEVENHIYPPYFMLNQRIQHFMVKIDNNKITEINLENAFGDTTGVGALIIVESIFADKKYDRLLIAEEDKNQNLVKVYNLSGVFQNILLGDDLIKFQAEGIMLYECGENEGYYFLTDQDFYKNNNNTFHIFNRKDLKYVGSFISDKIENTDGIWITNKKFSKFDKGALIAVNDDGGIGIIDIRKIFKALNLKCE